MVISCRLSVISRLTVTTDNHSPESECCPHLREMAELDNVVLRSWCLRDGYNSINRLFIQILFT